MDRAMLRKGLVFMLAVGLLLVGIETAPAAPQTSRNSGHDSGQGAATAMGLQIAGAVQAARPQSGQAPIQMATESAPPPPPAHWWALLIAADKYDRQASGLEPLSFCYEDMSALRNEWLIAAGVPAEKIVFLNDRQADLRPTKANIERELARITSRLGPGDVLFLGAAMHGVKLTEGSYLCPIDARVKFSKGKAAPETENLIGLPGLFESVAKCAAGFKLLIFDACRESLAQPPNAPSTNRRSEFITSLGKLNEKSRGMAVLVSCSEGQSAYELPESRHGAFVHFLLDGLAGAADLYTGNHDGVVSLREAAAYANRETKKKIFLKYQLWQEPDLLLGESTMNFPLALVEQNPSVAAAEDDLTFINRYGNTLLRWTMYGQAKEYDLSIDLLSHVVRSQPENREAYARRAVAYRAKGEYRLAMADFQKAGSPMELFAKYSDVPLSIENKTIATLLPGTRVSVSLIENKHLWVTAVNSDPARSVQGWVFTEHVTWDPGLAELTLPTTPQRRQPDGETLQRVIDVIDGRPYIPSYIPTSVSVPHVSIPSYPKPWLYIPSIPSYRQFIPSRPSLPSIPRPDLSRPSIPSWRSFIPF